MIEHVYKQEVEKMDIEGRHEIASARFSAYLCHRISATNDEVNHAYATELDSHADSPVVGQGARVLEHTGRNHWENSYPSDSQCALPSFNENELDPAIRDASGRASSQ